VLRTKIWPATNRPVGRDVVFALFAQLTCTFDLV